MNYASYYRNRSAGRALGYRLRRRTAMVAAAIDAYCRGPVRLLLDVGCADGLMVEGLRTRITAERWLGVDLDLDVIRLMPKKHTVVQGDALRLPVCDGAATVVVMTAVLEHVCDGRILMEEVRRVLRPGGICVATSPNPLMESLATRLGLLKDDTHERLYDLPEMTGLFETHGFRIQYAQRFMLSPIGMPFERQAETVLRGAGLGRLLANQLVVAENP